MTRQINHREALLEFSRFDGAKIVNLRAGGGGDLTTDLRKKLLASVMAGEHVELELELLAFEQKTGERNLQCVRIRDGAMLAFGRSAKGRPFLRDHQQGSVLSRGGTITDSATEKLDDGHYVVRQTVTLTAPWACEMALRGLLDSLSVNITPTSTVTCSVHGGGVFEECFCWRGDEVVDADGVKQIVEWVYNDADSYETSAVNNGAVQTAHIESIRAALMLSASEKNRGPESQRLIMNFAQKLCQVLGLAATTGETDILPLVEKLSADVRALGAELTGTRTALASSVTQLAEANAKVAIQAIELSTINTAKIKLDEDAFIETGKKRGAIGLGFDEDEMREDFRRDANLARARLAKRPDGARTPVGLGRDSAPLALVTGDLPANQQTKQEEISDADLDAGLMRLGLSADRVKSLRANLKATGMTDADIRKQLLGMSTAAGSK